jgi:hypothetical protein
MATFTVTGPDEAEKLSQFKKIAKIMGYSLKGVAMDKGKQRTKAELDFVEGYKEALAHKNGSIKLKTIGEFREEIEKNK